MIAKIDYKSGLPAYLQIVDQVKRAAASGSLKAGDVLPPIRTLAERLRINRNTVAKAYSELESQSVIEMHVGRGSVITANATPLKKAERQKMLDEAIDAAIVRSYHLQFDHDEFRQRAEQRLEEFKAQQAAANSAEGNGES